MIETVDNYVSFDNDTSTYYFNFDDKKTHINEKLKISLQDYIGKSSNNMVFSLLKDKKKIVEKDKDDLIISIVKRKDTEGKDTEDKDKYIAQTGNYVGNFTWNGIEIDINSRFSNKFLERMLNFANNIYLDDVSVSGKVSKELDISKYIIYYIFIQNLEKSFLLGTPKSYKSINYHEMKLKGKIDINNFIKNDIPFKGKISSTSREQKEIQEIIDVLYKAIKIIDKTEFNTKNISHIKTHLKQTKSNNYVSNVTIKKAMKSKALQNPIFASYKKVLEYAKYIINDSNIEQKAKEKKSTYGFLINVAELFEIYITKLLKKEFSEWSICSPKIETYPNQFFARKIIPDIVMIKDNDVLVFDTKYKRMKFRNRYQGPDVDRCDFFQINTYMSYYKNQNYNVKIGGLLYPIEANIEERINECHSESWFGNSDTKFIIEGVDLSTIGEEANMPDIVKFEQEFISRIRVLI